MVKVISSRNISVATYILIFIIPFTYIAIEFILKLKQLELWSPEMFL
jgi:hypothetical protein